MIEITPERWQRIKRIAAEAHDKPSADRSAYLTASCAGDSWLREEVESLLHAADAAALLYESPAMTSRCALNAIQSAVPDRLAPGDVIGSYRLVRELGQGGMGCVYLAERVDGEFEQQVAIKFIGGAPTESLRRRFKEERRILAALEHPNIARLLDGGATTGGGPYVIMEYVAGIQIDVFCDMRRLALRDRVRLFQQVCAAVQYAHQRLVIHRDIKAANILVTPDGTPKLLDFGIATFMQPDTALPPRGTTLRALTPESASPEQVRGEAITIATDVYALGVLLYRVVAGRSPYGDAVLSDTALLRAICDETPAPLNLDRDLDLIVLKALRKEPERRYSSAEQLSDDLSRYLSGRPVIAAPDSARYRARKFVRRHRASVATATVALLAVLGSAGAALYQARIAEQERARAEQRLADVRRLTNSFIFEFHDAIADLPGSLKARQLVVKRAAEYLDSLAREGHDDVTLQRELAAASVRLGDILGGAGVANLGDLTGAFARYRRALEIREALAARGFTEAADLEGMADVHVRLSRALIASGELERGEASARAAASLLQEHVTADGGGRLHGPLATAHQQLAFVQSLRGETRAALASLSQAIGYGQKHVDAHPGEAHGTARLARIQADYAQQLLGDGQPDHALTTLRAAQQNLARLIASEPANQRYVQTMLIVLNGEGQARWALKDVRGALEAYESAARSADRLRSASPDDQGARFAAAFNRHGFGEALLEAGGPSVALPHLRQSMTEHLALVTTAPTNDFFRYSLAAVALDLGRAVFRIDPRSSTGCREIEAGLEAWEQLGSRGRLPGEANRFVETFTALRRRCPSRAAAARR